MEWEMVDQLLADPNYAQASKAEIPEAYRVPNEPREPLFVQADFGLDENLEPKLVEIQGFPSLYAYQPVLSDAYREAFELDDSLVFVSGPIARGRVLAHPACRDRRRP